MSRVVQIQYLGAVEPRYDNIIPRSNRVWPKKGAVVDVPEEEAPMYLCYQGIFSRVGPRAVEDAVLRNANDATTVDMLCGLLGALNRENLERVIEQAQQLLAMEPERDDEEVDVSTPEAAKKYDRRVRAILATIQSLPINSDNYDLDSGKPLLAVVQRYCSEKNITQRELKAACALKKRNSM